MPSIPDPRFRGFALSSRPVLALDLGGTQIRAAVVQPDGSRLTRVATETPSELGPAAVIDACAAALVSARDGAPAEVRESIIGIGISSPGPVDPRAGVVVEPPNLGPDFRDVPLADAVEAALGLPTFLDRDTNVAALGEAAYGAGRGQYDFIYVTVSTGIGGSIVTDGRLFHGPDGMAGELGHVPVELDGPICGCGGRGHLEAVASGTALAREAREAVMAGSSPFLVARAAEIGLAELSARDVAEGDDAGDATCGELMGRDASRRRDGVRRVRQRVQPAPDHHRWGHRRGAGGAAARPGPGHDRARVLLAPGGRGPRRPAGARRGRVPRGRAPARLVAHQRSSLAAQRPGHPAVVRVPRQ